MDVWYVGPHDAVEVPMPSGAVELVEHGKPLKTSTEHGKALLEQKSNWSATKPAPKKDGPPATASAGEE